MPNPLAALVRDPLTYFLVAGTAVFLVWNWLQTDQYQHHIEVTVQEHARIAAQWEAQMGHPPTPGEMSGLVDQFVREEIYYREALRLGLDKNDTIIRRRLAQKLSFLTEDIATAQPANNEQLQEFYQQHLDDYTEPDKYSFQHRYFSIERHKDARVAATLAITALNHGHEPTDPGDSFLLQSEFSERSQREVAELFGSEFADAVAHLERGEWQGPILSAYGWHAVILKAHLGARQLPFTEVAERVVNDRNHAARNAANEAHYQNLRSRYQVVGQ